MIWVCICTKYRENTEWNNVAQRIEEPMPFSPDNDNERR